MPLAALVFFAALALSSLGYAQGQDSTATADTLSTTPATTSDIDREPQSSGENEGGFLRSPTGVAFRSLLIPGWGQATNEEWVKTGIVVGVEGFLIVRFFQDLNTLNSQTEGTFEYEQAQDNLIGSAFWLGGAVLLSMLDAYIGAHLKGVDAKIEPEPQEMGVSLRLQTRF